MQRSPGAAEEDEYKTKQAKPSPAPPRSHHKLRSHPTGGQIITSLNTKQTRIC